MSNRKSFGNGGAGQVASFPLPLVRQVPPEATVLGPPLSVANAVVFTMLTSLGAVVCGWSVEMGARYVRQAEQLTATNRVLP